MNFPSGGQQRPPLDLTARLSRTRSPAASRHGHHLDFLVADLKSGSSRAYGELYALTADRLYRVAYRLLRDRQEAEDAVQEAFLELVRHRCPPSDGASIEAWLRTSVRYSSGDQFRRRKRQPYTPTALLPEVDDEDEYWLGYDPDLEAALARLTKTQRLVVHLKHVEGLTGNQIAKIVGSSRVAVYAIASRAESALQRELVAIGQHTDEVVIDGHS